jgi:hypothetical protein
MGHDVRVMDGSRVLRGAFLVTLGLFLTAAPASAAGEQVLPTASYPGMTTYNCATDPMTVLPGENRDLYGLTKTCPNAQKVSGPGDPSIFAPGSKADGYMTRFQPSMVEVHDDGSVTTPSVWDLHLHHVVWLGPGVGFGTGEEKTEDKFPQGYGFKLPADQTFGLNYMIHNLTAISGRRVQITWQIDWVPETTPARTDIQPLKTIGLDVAGAPQLYPVFDAERGFDLNGDGRYTFPDDVPTDPAIRGAPERQQRRQLDRSGRRPHPRLRGGPPAPGRALHGHEGHARRRDQAAVPFRCALLRTRRRSELGRGDDRDGPRLAHPPEGG